MIKIKSVTALTVAPQVLPAYQELKMKETVNQKKKNFFIFNPQVQMVIVSNG